MHIHFKYTYKMILIEVGVLQYRAQVSAAVNTDLYYQWY